MPDCGLRMNTASPVNQCIKTIIHLDRRWREPGHGNRALYGQRDFSPPHPGVGAHADDVPPAADLAALRHRSLKYSMNPRFLATLSYSVRPGVLVVCVNQ